jgi:hypothetical protein
MVEEPGVLGVTMPAVLIRQGREDSKVWKTEKGVIRGVFMRRRIVYEAFSKQSASLVFNTTRSSHQQPWIFEPR